MKSKFIASREEISFFIPYGRVLSKLFSQEEIVKKVQEFSLTEALVTYWSLNIDVAERTSGVGPSSP